MGRNRVVVTGMGMVSPLGHNVADSWTAILAGKSGAAPIERFDASSFATQFSASVKNLDLSPYLSEKEARKVDPFIQYGMAAGIQAVEDSGLQVTPENAERIGCVIGSGIGGLGSIEETALTIKERGPRRISPFFVPGSIINMIAGNLSIRYGFKGSNIAITTACTTGTHCIGLAAREIMFGYADAMICGGSEMATTPVGIGGFGAARALAMRAQRAARAGSDDSCCASWRWFGGNGVAPNVDSSSVRRPARRRGRSRARCCRGTHLAPGSPARSRHRNWR